MVALHEDRYVNSIIIPKNSGIPVSQSKVFDNPFDDMTELDVKLLQGESRDPELCTLLKQHTFKGIQPMPRGQERIEVTFSYTKNGTVDVSARDLNTDRILEHVETEIGSLQLEPVQPISGTGGGFSNIALILDCSYSMMGEDFSNAKKAGKEFLNNTLKKRSDIEVCLITVGGDSAHNTVLAVPFTNQIGNITSVINQLKVGGSTPLDRSIEFAISALEGRKGRSLMVIVSDGMPDNQGLSLRAATKASENGIECSTIGIGLGEHNKFLEKISTMSHFGDLVSSDLQKSFDSIFREI
jgi:molecular chaperone DnaK